LQLLVEAVQVESLANLMHPNCLLIDVDRDKDVEIQWGLDHQADYIDVFDLAVKYLKKLKFQKI
jgi:hypothetical protein